MNVPERLDGALAGPNSGSGSAINGERPSSNKEPLTVLIAGAGIGGLTAAIALRQQGHHVKLLEQSRFATESGAAIHLAPNCNGILRRLGVIAESFGSNTANRFTDLTHKGEVIHSADLKQSSALWQHPWLFAHRVHLHTALKEAATAADRPGTAELFTSSRVKSIDEHKAIVFLDNGDEIRGDVIVGADGVHSTTRLNIAPDLKPFSSGKSAFRFLLPRADVMGDPTTSLLAREEGELKVWYSKDRRVVMYPTSNNQLLNFVCIHPDRESNASEDWHTETSLEKLLQVYQAFDPAVVAMLSKADPKTLRVWTLLDLDEIPVWSKDRLALIGDAAHPFTPHLGQGGGQAIEDAAALSVVLPLGTRKEEIAERLRLYDTIRHERASKIQEFSRLLGHDDFREKNLDMLSFTEYNFGHDEFDNAAQKFREHQWANTPSKYWRMPIAFGPMPGPHQDHYGLSRSGYQSTFTTATVKFKTSRTVLQNLFPPGKSGYSFKNPGTVAYASFSQTTLNNLEWLGGSGYNHIGLYIHGVQYKKADGTTITGTYTPVLFENLADPIVSGREELGMPKLYSAIDVYRREGSYIVKTSWQGANWGRFSFTGLTAVDPATESGSIGVDVDEGTLFHRYIPAVGTEHKGEAEADYACFDRFDEAKPQSKPLNAWKATDAEFEMDGMNWSLLPTLHHVVERLAELPVYEVVKGTVVEGTGVPDLSGARPV